MVSNQYLHSNDRLQLFHKYFFGQRICQLVLEFQCFKPIEMAAAEENH